MLSKNFLDLHWGKHRIAPIISTCAASAYFPSGFDHAAILTVDGLGETGLLTCEGRRNVYPVRRNVRDRHSIGFLWEAFSGLTWFSHYDASKVMGLAAYGIPRSSVSNFYRSCAPTR